MFLLIGKVFRLWGMLADHVALPRIGRIYPSPCLLAIQRIGQKLAVMHVLRRGRNRVDQFSLTVDPDMRLHAEVPLVVLFRLMHFWVLLALLVFGGTGRIDDRGTYNSRYENHLP